MRNISIADVTMRQRPEEGGYPLSFREKIELAKLLDRLEVTVIETGPIVNRRSDSLLIKSLASAVKGSRLAVPLSPTERDTVEVTWNALREAVAPRLQVVIPVSTVQMEYICHQKPAAILEQIGDFTRAAAALCEEVEFVAEDAGRSEPEFLKQAITKAVESGASLVTVCDTAGTLLPEEFGQSIEDIRSLLPSHVKLGVRCSGALGLADANAIAAIEAGADEVKTAACGTFTTSLEKLAHILKLRGGDFDVSCAVRDTELRRVAGQIRWMCESERSKSSPFENGVQSGREDFRLTAHDDAAAVAKAAALLGYELSEEDNIRVYEAFSRIVARKEEVGARELDAIIASAALQVPATYTVERYIINCGNVLAATCQMRLNKAGQTLEGLGIGDGPIDAAFLALEQITGHHYELDDFQIQAVTEGREAMGETVVRLRANGKVYSGRGISTDIIGSGIRAYVNAVNKIVYEEGENQI